MSYESPEIVEVGSLTELTHGALNKVGKKADAYTASIEAAISEDIVGSTSAA